MRMRYGIKSRRIIFLTGLMLLISTGAVYAFSYTVKANVNLRTGPGTTYEKVGKLRHNQTLKLISTGKNWSRVRTLTGKTGYVRNDMISDIWVKIYKKERQLSLVKGENRILQTFKVGLSSFNAGADKSVLGDGGTPEGRFFLCEMIKYPKKSRYGARSMRISYPAIEDARRGLKEKSINMDQYLSIVKSIRNGKMPDQQTKLGGSIRIHGGGSSSDWTLGCVALDDKAIEKIYTRLQKGSRVEIYHSEAREKALNAKMALNKKILSGATKQLKNPALYTIAATKVIRLSYPGGDIPSDEAVCTDIVIRSLREAGIDLQPLVHEDALIDPQSYRPEIDAPSYHIDHRRVRTLKRFFDRYMVDLSVDPKGVRPGDIVIMDTGIQNGTKCDHIGIVGDTRDENGNFNVINIWTVGEKTEPLSLMGRSYPEIAACYRLTHPFDYDAF